MVYVAAPYGEKEENKNKVEMIIKALVRENPEKTHVSPIHSFGHLYSDVDYDTGMGYCLELLSKCEEMILCKGWCNSRGCLIEKEYAENAKIRIRLL